MKPLLYSLSLFACSSSVAMTLQCPTHEQQLGAKYSIEYTQNGQSQIEAFELWRSYQQVAHAGQNNITEVWQKLSNGQIRPIRYFEDYQHGIEYQPIDLTGQGSVPAWQDKYQLITQTQLSSMTLKEQHGEGCQQVQRFVLNNESIQLTVEWLPELHLVKSLQAVRAEHTEQWLLDKLIVATDQVNAQFNRWDNFQTTDYADIGDNESNPLLAKMIKQGFIEHGASGFYNADGSAIHSGHHH